MAYLELDDARVYYETRGAGVPLVLIAGLASDSQSWLSVIEGLAARFFVVSVDNRGAGRTIPADSPASLRTMADDCARLICSLGIGPAHILGHSMGGFIAQDLAIRHPGLVRRLVLAGTAPVNSKRNNALFATWAASKEAGLPRDVWFRSLFFWILSEEFFKNGEAVEFAVRYSVEYPYPQSVTAFRNQVQAIAVFDCLEEVKRITAPSLVLAASEDLLFSPSVCARHAREIPSAQFRQIDGAGHSMHMERPEEFLKIVLDFLESDESPK